MLFEQPWLAKIFGPKLHPEMQTLGVLNPLNEQENSHVVNFQQKKSIMKSTFLVFCEILRETFRER